jgi:hypothetical protein
MYPTFTVHAGLTALLELLPDPKVEAYRLSAEVAQRRRATGAVGLYFGRTRVMTDKATLHWCARFDFADQRRVGPDLTRVGLGIRYFHETQTGNGRHETGWDCLAHSDAPDFSSWRRLSVEVTPHKVKVFWQGQQIQPARPGPMRLADKVPKWRNVLADDLEAVGFDRSYPDPEFTARGGLGLFLEDCTASFRNVRIESLAGQE